MKCVICGKPSTYVIDLILHRMRIPLCGTECNSQMLKDFAYTGELPGKPREEEFKVIYAGELELDQNGDDILRNWGKFRGKR